MAYQQACISILLEDMAGAITTVTPSSDNGLVNWRNGWGCKWKDKKPLLYTIVCVGLHVRMCIPITSVRVSRYERTCRATRTYVSTLMLDEVHELFTCLRLLEETGKIGRSCQGVLLLYTPHLHAHVLRLDHDHYT